MKFLLKLKHWQLFLILWVPYLAIYFFMPETSLNYILLNKVAKCVFLVGFWAWVWAIATVLNSKLGFTTELNINKFKILFVATIAWMLLVIIGSSFVGDDFLESRLFYLVYFISLLMLALVLLTVRFAAKTIKSAELGKIARFDDYALYFFSILFSVVGIWLVQPRLNKLN